VASYLKDLSKLYTENVNINGTTEHATSYMYAPMDYREEMEEVNLPLEGAQLIGAILTEDSRKTLLEHFPPMFSNVRAHHVTIAFKPDEETLEKYQHLIGQQIEIPVFGIVKDAKSQVLLVHCPSENPHPHITISFAENSSAKYSNELAATQPGQKVMPLTLQAVVTLAAA